MTLLLPADEAIRLWLNCIGTLPSEIVTSLSGGLTYEYLFQAIHYIIYIPTHCDDNGLRT